MHLASIGVDLGKTTFHLVALAEQGKAVEFWVRGEIEYVRAESGIPGHIRLADYPGVCSLNTRKAR